jgi:hypothetical protein
MKSIKVRSLVIGGLVVLLPLAVMAKLKPETIAKDAQDAEKEVDKDLKAGLIEQSDADTYNDKLNHVIAVMSSQNSSDSERGHMREEVFQIVDELKAKESGGKGSTGMPSMSH